QAELLEQIRIELPPALVPREELVAVRRLLERVPADDDRTRPLRFPQPHEEVRDAEQHVPRSSLGAAKRLRECVVGAVRERVAVDDEERPAHSPSWSRSISTI